MTLVIVAPPPPTTAGPQLGTDPSFTLTPVATWGGLTQGVPFTGTSQQFWAKFLTQGSGIPVGVPVLDPTRTNYPANTVTQQVIGGQVYLFRNPNAGGPFAAPTTYNGTANWQPVAKSVPAQALTVSYALGYAQGVLLPQKKVAGGVKYLLRGQWNGSSTPAVVMVVGIPGDVTGSSTDGDSTTTPLSPRFASQGLLLNDDGTTTPVAVDVAAGTYERVETAGVLIDNQGNVFTPDTTTFVGNSSNNIVLPGGADNTLSATGSNLILGGTGGNIISNVTNGGGNNVLIGSYGCTLTDCEGVTLFNCQNFTPPPGTTDAEYRNNQLVTSGGGGSDYVVATGDAATLDRPGTTDYGTQAGAFTVDCTGAVPDALVRYYLAAGAPAPTFTNMPGSKPVHYYGSFTAGQAHAVSISVASTEIQVAFSPSRTAP